MAIEKADWLKSMTGHAIREINTLVLPLHLGGLVVDLSQNQSSPIEPISSHCPLNSFQNAQLHFCTTQELFAHSNNFLGNACKKL